MDSGYYAACSGLITRMRALDTIANNLANASTVGFRAEHNEFSSVMASRAGDDDTPLNQAINDFGVFGGVTVDQSQGSLQKTDNPLDVAIQGNGYFAVKTSNGVMYTRNGSFTVSGKGQLETATGDLVMGDGDNPITMVPGKVAISANGTISTNGAVTGKLKIVEFPEGTQITSMGNTYYSAPANKEEAPTHSDLRQGMLENSNVNPITGMVELVTAQRSAEMMQRALAMFNTEMDKIASQDIAKVS
jgi:flagellar basal-body rod protein FlgF